MHSPYIGLNEENLNQIISDCNEQRKKLVLCVGESGEFKTTLVKFYFSKTMKKESQTEEITFYKTKDLIICDTPGLGRKKQFSESLDLQSLIPFASSIIMVTNYRCNFYKQKILEMAQNISNCVAKYNKKLNLNSKPILQILVWVADSDDACEIPQLYIHIQELIREFKNHNFLAIEKYVLSPIPEEIIYSMHSQKDRFRLEEPPEFLINEINDIFSCASKSNTKFIDPLNFKKCITNQKIINTSEEEKSTDYDILSILKKIRDIYPSEISDIKILRIEEFEEMLEKSKNSYIELLQKTAFNENDLQKLMRDTKSSLIESEERLKCHFNSSVVSNFSENCLNILKEYENFIQSIKLLNKSNSIEETKEKGNSVANKINEKYLNRKSASIANTSNYKNQKSPQKKSASIRDEPDYKSGTDFNHHTKTYNENSPKAGHFEFFEENRELNFLIPKLQKGCDEYSNAKTKICEIKLILAKNFEDKTNEAIIIRDENLKKLENIFLNFFISTTDDMLLKGISNKFMNSIEPELRKFHELNMYLAYLQTCLDDFSRVISEQLDQIKKYSGEVVINFEEIEKCQKYELEKRINETYFTNVYSEHETLTLEIGKNKIEFESSVLKMHKEFQKNPWELNIIKEFENLKGKLTEDAKKITGSSYFLYENSILSLIKHKEEQVKFVIKNNQLTRTKNVRCTFCKNLFSYEETLQSYWDRSKFKVECNICHRFSPKNNTYDTEKTLPSKSMNYSEKKFSFNEAQNINTKKDDLYLPYHNNYYSNNSRNLEAIENSSNNFDISFNDSDSTTEIIERLKKEDSKAFIKSFRSSLKNNTRISSQEKYSLNERLESHLKNLIKSYKILYLDSITTSTTNIPEINFKQNYESEFEKKIEPLLNDLRRFSLTNLIDTIEQYKEKLSDMLLNTSKDFAEYQDEVKKVISDLNNFLEPRSNSEQGINNGNYFISMIEEHSNKFIIDYDFIFYLEIKNFINSVKTIYTRLCKTLIENEIKAKNYIKCPKCDHPNEIPCLIRKVKFYFSCLNCNYNDKIEPSSYLLSEKQKLKFLKSKADKNNQEMMKNFNISMEKIKSKLREKLNSLFS